MSQTRGKWVAVVGGALVGLIIVAAVLAPVIAPHDPNAQDFRPLLGLSGRHPFGTDEFGRDLLSRVIYGARVSVIVSVVGVGLGTAIGILLGLAAGLRRGLIESAIMRTSDVLLAYPGIILAIAVVALFGPGSSRIVGAVAVINIPVFVRITHSAVLKEAALDYTRATISLGATQQRLAFRHLLPNALPAALPQISLSLGGGVMIEAALSFLGLGAQPPTASWGAMLAESRPYLGSVPMFAILPGLCLMLFTVGLNLLGDFARDTLTVGPSTDAPRRRWSLRRRSTGSHRPPESDQRVATTPNPMCAHASDVSLET